MYMSDEQILNELNRISEKIDTLKKEEYKNKREKKIHNTKLLLKNYRKLKAHTQSTTATIDKLIDGELLNAWRDTDIILSELYISSVIKTKQRTAIILEYIDKAIDYYKYSTRNNAIEHRRANMLYDTYVLGKTQREIADSYYIETRTVRADLSQAIEDLTPLLFGVDGLKMD